MDIDQRLTLGISLIALLMAVFAYKEIFEMREFHMLNDGPPDPPSFDSMMASAEPADDDDDDGDDGDDGDDSGLPSTIEEDDETVEE